MFYSTQILARKGPLGLVWIAAHMDSRLKRNQVFETSIPGTVDAMLNSEAPLALRLTGQLLLGVDCNDALVKIRLAFRPNAIVLEVEGAYMDAPQLGRMSFSTGGAPSSEAMSTLSGAPSSGTDSLLGTVLLSQSQSQLLRHKSRSQLGPVLDEEEEEAVFEHSDPLPFDVDDLEVERLQAAPQETPFPSTWMTLRGTTSEPHSRRKTHTFNTHNTNIHNACRPPSLRPGRPKDGAPLNCPTRDPLPFDLDDLEVEHLRAAPQDADPHHQVSDIMMEIAGNSAAVQINSESGGTGGTGRSKQGSRGGPGSSRPEALTAPAMSGDMSGAAAAGSPNGWSKQGSRVGPGSSRPEALIAPAMSVGMSGAAAAGSPNGSSRPEALTAPAMSGGMSGAATAGSPNGGTPRRLPLDQVGSCTPGSALQAAEQRDDGLHDMEAFLSQPKPPRTATNTTEAPPSAAGSAPLHLDMDMDGDLTAPDFDAASLPDIEFELASGGTTPAEGTGAAAGAQNPSQGEARAGVGRTPAISPFEPLPPMSAPSTAAAVGARAGQLPPLPPPAHARSAAARTHMGGAKHPVMLDAAGSVASSRAARALLNNRLPLLAPRGLLGRGDRAGERRGAARANKRAKLSLWQPLMTAEDAEELMLQGCTSHGNVDPALVGLLLEAVAGLRPVGDCGRDGALLATGADAIPPTGGESARVTRASQQLLASQSSPAAGVGAPAAEGSPPALGALPQHSTPGQLGPTTTGGLGPDSAMEAAPRDFAGAEEMEMEEVALPDADMSHERNALQPLDMNSGPLGSTAVKSPWPAGPPSHAKFGGSGTQGQLAPAGDEDIPGSAARLGSQASQPSHSQGREASQGWGAVDPGTPWMGSTPGGSGGMGGADMGPAASPSIGLGLGSQAMPDSGSGGQFGEFVLCCSTLSCSSTRSRVKGARVVLAWAWVRGKCLTPAAAANLSKRGMGGTDMGPAGSHSTGFGLGSQEMPDSGSGSQFGSRSSQPLQVTSSSSLSQSDIEAGFTQRTHHVLSRLLSTSAQLSQSQDAALAASQAGNLLLSTSAQLSQSQDAALAASQASNLLLSTSAQLSQSQDAALAASQGGSLLLSTSAQLSQSQDAALAASQGGSLLLSTSAQLSQSQDAALAASQGGSLGGSQAARDASQASQHASMPLSQVVEGKTRLDASRWFFEMLVLKSRGMVELEQGAGMDDISITLTQQAVMGATQQ
eukprot:gene21184-28084_t